MHQMVEKTFSPLSAQAGEGERAGMDPTVLPAACVSFCKDNKRVSEKMLGSQRISAVSL